MPIIYVINKIDLSIANAEKVIEQMTYQFKIEKKTISLVSEMILPAILDFSKNRERS